MTLSTRDYEECRESNGRFFLIKQLEEESSEDLPNRELIGLEKKLRSIRGSLKVEMAKKVGLQQCTE